MQTQTHLTFPELKMDRFNTIRNSSILYPEIQIDSTTNIKQCHSRSLEPYECELCPFETDLKVILTDHVNVIHKKSKSVTCYSEIVQRNCLICNFQTHTVLGLASHVCRTKPKSVEKLHNFVIIGKREKLENGDSNQSIHQNTDKTNSYHMYKGAHDYPKKPTRFKWDHCSFKSKQSSKVRRHSFDKHNDFVDWFQCNFCSYITKDKDNLKRHISYKHSIFPMDWFQCSQCDYKSKTKQCLQSHRKRKHTDPLDITMHKCDQCSYASKDKNNLKQHVFNKHTEAGKIKPYMCEECPFRTKTKTLLERHFERIHKDLSEIKLFECTQCPYKSKQKCGLQNHILFQHTKPQDVKWFKCEHCLYRAKVKYQLKRHLKDKHKVDMVL